MGDLKPRVLFVNHREQACGVFQFFKRLTEPVLHSTNFDCFYIDPAEGSEFDYWVAELKPQIVVYNYYTGATMPWLSPQKVASQRHLFKQACIFHEINLDHMGFDLIYWQDPDHLESATNIALARPIPTFTKPASFYLDSDIPTIGSFGFGLGGKGFTRLAALVCQQFAYAHLRINIPYAKFGDENGEGARRWADQIRACMTNENVTLEVTHDFMDEPQLLGWLSHNDINCFLYDANIGRGISGTTDYALSVNRPIAITMSDQFKHLWKMDSSFLVENNTIPNILAKGTDHLQKFHDRWNNLEVIKSFEKGFLELAR